MTARKPDRLKLITGTFRPNRAAPKAPGLPPVDAVPTPPDWLPNHFAANEWRRLAPVLVANRLLHDVNASMLCQLCALHGRLVQTWTAGSTPTAALITAYRALSGELGLLSMTVPVAKPNNRFSNNAKSRKGAR